MELTVRQTTEFRRGLKRAKKRNLPESELWTVVEMLKKQIPLPARYKDHALTGNYKGKRECHIRPDWLLIYQIKDTTLELLLTETGSHSELFGNSLKVDAAKVVRNALMAMR